ncbi:hypothetical protein OEIGOIKO_03549 [Streptomyces chrestomyceticus JCM 4735]|uniref:TniQ domain-containing protein n=1 Tax=Streptomyces chrestomyceticus JCM 4735 TaxID=1306181 RepID=A0A7U9KUS9_9ACTN|nr:hypothetical protein OEIGOIKO_03549 [Streptomyces chrestomyceticus JCM 4735]
MLLAPLGERYGPLNPAFTPRTTPTRMIYDNPWVLTRSSRYCPFCLAGHGEAIQDRHGGAWQRLWRLPVIFLCLRHRGLLSHRCTSCGTLAQFVHTANGIARLSDDSLHPTQCRFTARLASHRQPTGACGADLARPDTPPGEPDPVTMNVLFHVQRELGHLLAAGGPATTMSAGAPVPVAHYFADLRAIVAMIFRSWPEARPYASTPVLAAALDAEHAARAAKAEPLLNSAGKKKTSKPYTVPPDDSLVTGAVLDIAAQLLGTRTGTKHESAWPHWCCACVTPTGHSVPICVAQAGSRSSCGLPSRTTGQVPVAEVSRRHPRPRPVQPSHGLRGRLQHGPGPLAARVDCPRLHPPHTPRTRRRRLKHHHASAAHRDSGAPSPRLADSTTRPLGSTGSFGFAPQAPSARRHEEGQPA